MTYNGEPVTVPPYGTLLLNLCPFMYTRLPIIDGSGGVPGQSA